MEDQELLSHFVACSSRSLDAGEPVSSAETGSPNPPRATAPSQPKKQKKSKPLINHRSKPTNSDKDQRPDKQDAPPLDISNLRCMYTNADELLLKRREELAANVAIYEPHIIVVTEVKPKVRSNIDILDYKIDGYTPRYHPDFTSEGRGILLFTVHALDNHIAELTPSITAPDLPESLWISIKLRAGDSLLLGAIYRSPSKDNHAQLRDLLNDVVRTQGQNFTHVALLGDFNYPKISWRDHGPTTSSDAGDSPENLFLECIRDSFLFQHVDQPTRSRGSDTPSVLDLVFTNEAGMVSEISYLPPLDGSDHMMLLFDVHCYVEYNRPSNKFAFDKGDYDAMRAHLQTCSWDPGGEPDANDLWDRFASNLLAARDQFIPTHVSSNKPSWKAKPGAYNPDAATRQLIRDKARKHNLFMEHRNKPDAEAYRKSYTRARNHVRTTLRKKKRLFERGIAEQAKSCPKKFFAYCSGKMRTRSGISPLLSNPVDKDSAVFSDADKSEVLQQQYCSVFTDEGPGPIPEFAQRCNTELPRITIQVEKVKKKLKAINISKSAGPDGLHPRLLQECAEVIAEPLAKLYQVSIDTGVVPAPWKESVVSPIFKKGSRSLAANYRPVSLTAILCKTMEDLIREAIMDHLTRHKLLSNRQFGFVKGRSTSLQLLNFLDDIAKFLAEGGASRGAVDAVYLDYQKAFDTVPHRRLLLKLKAYGIVGSTLAWIESFLTGRTQRVSVNGTLSGEQNVRSGVPQGSVLGPLLFLLFINDIADDLETNLLLFADDSKLYSAIRSAEDIHALQRDLVRLEAWSDKWLLKFHPDKCHVLSFGREDAMANLDLWHGQYQLCGHTLDHVSEEKDLGVIVDSQLSFISHIDAIVAKANSFLGLIRRNFQFLDASTLCTLYKSFVRPHLEYAHAAWSPSSAGLITKLENVQRRALSLVPELQSLPYEEQLRRVKLTTLAFRRFRGDLIEAWKHINVYERDVIPASFQQSQHHPERLRQTHASSALCRKLFYHRVQEAWNALPASCRELGITLNCFKSRIDRHYESVQFPLLYNPLVNPTRFFQNGGARRGLR